MTGAEVGVKYPQDSRQQRWSTGGQQLARDVSNLCVATFSKQKFAFVCNTQIKEYRSYIGWSKLGLLVDFSSEF